VDSPPNKRMQLAALQIKGTSDSVRATKSPQLMRGPLGRIPFEEITDAVLRLLPEGTAAALR